MGARLSDDLERPQEFLREFFCWMGGADVLHGHMLGLGCESLVQGVGANPLEST